MKMTLVKLKYFGMLFNVSLNLLLAIVETAIGSFKQ